MTTAVMPAPPARIAVDSADPCAAPGCGIPLDQHTGRPYHVDGYPVGSDQCARALYTARRAMPTVTARDCCGEVFAEACLCADLAGQAATADARGVIVIRFGGAR